MYGRPVGERYPSDVELSIDGRPGSVPVTLTAVLHSVYMRPILFLPIALALCGPDAAACTAFKVTHAGRTLIGNNEDAWSINAQVRFEQGRDGAYGAVYFGQFNGHPLLHMVDQLGMNEAGLVFDGLAIQPKTVARAPGTRALAFDALMPLVMRTCATVHEAATLLRTYDLSWLTRSMLFLADRTGDYLIVEADTLILGNAPAFAVGNWRMSTCSDPGAIPIPRLQAGRALLAAGLDSTVAYGIAVLERMKACRSRMGEGTLFSTLFDPANAQVHCFFYHDFRERITIDLRSELAKGDRTLPLAPLFGERPEYERLKAYATPFHHAWLFRWMAAWGGLAFLMAAACAAWVLRGLVRRLRKRSAGPLGAWLWSGIAFLLTGVLLGILLLTEAPYYFGLADVHPALAWLPLAIVACAIAAILFARRPGASRGVGWVVGAFLLPVFLGAAYWGVLVP